jgi:glycerate kinase
VVGWDRQGEESRCLVCGCGENLQVLQDPSNSSGGGVVWGVMGRAAELQVLGAGCVLSYEVKEADVALACNQLKARQRFLQDSSQHEVKGGGGGMAVKVVWFGGSSVGTGNRCVGTYRGGLRQLVNCASMRAVW